jgi:lysophospholipase L1-like esterase
MMKPIQRFLLPATLIVSSAFSADFYLKTGDRVVFYGDSITDQRLYTVIAETYVVTRYPQLDVTFVHSGWGGDRVTGGGGGHIDVRLQRDVLAYKPTVMTIMLGMNDGAYRFETEKTDRTFFDGYRHIVESMKASDPGVRITAINPSPYDDVTRDANFPGGYNDVLISFGKWIDNYAAEAGLTVADLNTGVVAMLKKANAYSHGEAQSIIPDRVHPAFAGHLIMAEELVKAWNGRPIVSSVTIDASSPKPKLQNAEDATVTELAAAASITWRETDNALPLPFPQWEKLFKPLDLVLKSSDATSALNQEMLTVRGLPSGVYSVKIDNESVADFNNEDLAQGVNLALLDTPITRQAQEVYDLTVTHCDLHNEVWRDFQLSLDKYKLAETEAAIQALNALEKSVLGKRRQMAQPKEHIFEVVAVK